MQTANKTTHNLFLKKTNIFPQGLQVYVIYAQHFRLPIPKFDLFSFCSALEYSDVQQRFFYFFISIVWKNAINGKTTSLKSTL